MTTRRTLSAALVSAALTVPMSAFAATVITAPATAQMGAPALGLPMLLVVTVILTGIGAWRIRTSAGKTMAALALATGLSIAGGLVYAIGTITIDGADCFRSTVSAYPSYLTSALQSLCPNDIRIVTIDPDCESMAQNACGAQGTEETFIECTEGLVLSTNESCILPDCGCVP